MSMDCTNLAANAKRCSCTYPGCPRHGVCCDCVAYHRRSGELPGCFFSPSEERTFDRSVDFFIRARS